MRIDLVFLVRSLQRFLRVHIVAAASALIAVPLLSILFLFPEASSGSARLRWEGSLDPFVFAPPDTGKEDAKQPTPQTGGRGSGRSRTGGRSIGGATGSFSSDTSKGTRLLAEDSTWVVYLDSTARLAQWKYKRVDKPQVEIFPDRVYPLFAAPTQSRIRYEFAPDSSYSRFRFRKTLDGTDIRIPVGVPLKDYVKARLDHERWKMLADEVRKPGEIGVKKDIGDVLSSFTKISIPVPANPLFSIFGKNEINLQISGAVDIRAGFRNTSNDQQTFNRFDQTRNEPDFNQEVQVAVNGTIGDKLNILADWNTQRVFEYENQLKIKYTGYDDEIVQSVEAGNVSLQTPSSFIGQSAALFGLKAKFQAGPLTLTTIASQKKGQVKEVTASGGAQEQPFSIEAYDYSTNYYFVDTTYRSSFEPYYVNEPPQITSGNQIVEEEVWVSFFGNEPSQTATARQGVGHVLLNQRGAAGYNDSLRNATQPPGRVEAARFRRLDRSEYELLGDGYTGVLALNAVNDQQVVAIAYRTADGRQYGDLTRDIPSTDTSRTFVFKMVKPKNLSSVGPTYDIAWRQLLKNVYSLRLRNIKKAGFELDVYRREDSGDPVNLVQNEPLLRVLGVDRFNADDSPAPDGDKVFDFRPGRTVKEARAEIIFPYLEPFRSGLINYFRQRSIAIDTNIYAFREIYDTTKTAAQQSIRNRYSIKGKATGETSSKYNLGFNVVEGSVRVYLRERQLVANVDYTVDYILGEVVIRSPEALVPGAPLQIKYEQNDLFQLASKTLLGARGDLFISPTTSMGFTIMNLNQQSLSDKVRLGEEPNKNTIMGIDGQTSFNLPFMTSAINGLPGIATRESSELKLSGEAAYVSPDPNTRKSTIPSDGGAGIAYIDDFEGARRTIPLGTNFASWYQPSPPVDTLFGADDTSRMFRKAKTIWYNVYNSVQLTDVYPQKRAGNAASNQLTVMDVAYFPRTRGMYNYFRRGRVDTLLERRNWGGIMRPISISGTNLVQENISFIEVWMEVIRNGGARGTGNAGKMYVDLGSISEDAIPNRRLNTEDLVDPTRSINNSLQPDEDVGLDLLTNAQELALYGDINGDGDPSGDDFSYSTNSTDYSRINGTENNRNSQNGIYPDTEDLNANGIVDLANSYFRYEVSLDTIRSRNPRIVGGGNRKPDGTNSSYYQFRIPISDTLGKVGSPSFENIEFIRVTFQNEDTVYVRFADFSLVGNQWQELQKEDPAFAVSVIGVEENSDVYKSPPGVIRERDKTRPDEEILANEQSLNLILRGIPDGQSRQAVKYFATRPLDLFNYRTMKMFVHGDDTTMRQGDEAEFFYQFGSDSLNFYEYRAPIYAGWDSRNEVVIKFADLTAIKQGRDSLNQRIQIPVEGGPPGAVYRVRGNPSLTQIRYMALGVENPAGRGTTDSLFGSVWVNELRVIEVDDSPGWAYRFDASLKLADLGSVSFNYSKVDPNFHSIDQRFGSRQLGTNWGISTSIELGKFFPTEWGGTTLPISYSHAENLVRPKYLPSSDVLVTEAADLEKQRLINKGFSPEVADAAAANLKLSSETYRTTDTWASPNFKINIPTDEWWIRDTWNKLGFGFNYTKSRERNPITAYRLTWQWNARITYALTLNPDYYFQPFKNIFDGLWFLDEYKDMKIWFAPQNFNWSLSANRSRDVSQQRASTAQQQINRNFNASRALSFGWKLTEGGLLNLSGDYGLNIESTLLGLEGPQGTQRPFSKILDDIFFSTAFINLGQDTRYSQRNNFNTRPNIPNIFNIKKYLDLTLSYGVDYSWQNTLTSGDAGKSAGWSNNINFSMNFKLKSLFDPLFEDSPNAAPPTTKQIGRRSRESEDMPLSPGDSTLAQAPSDTTAPEGSKGLSKTLDQLKQLARVFIKVPLLDYENINITFTQTNNSANSGVLGRPGFVNFWGRVPFFQEADPKYGPSRLYQLGLISDPHGRLTNFGARSKFPFFGWDVQPGPRAAGFNLQNTYRQTNRLSFKTSRALWEGARLDLNWNVGWSFSSTESFETDRSGRVIRDGSRPLVLSTSGSVDRSFLTLPNFLFLSSLKSDLNEVAKRYQALKANKSDSAAVPEGEKLARAFEEGFESLPFLRKLFGQYAPRVNWSLRWDGLERLPMFASFVNRLSLEHAYTSSYTRSFANRPNGGGERTEGQRITYGFAPLLGLNFTFKDLLKGNMGANVRYNTNTTYDLAVSSANIVETQAREISVTASYSRRGFEIPFFGLSLNNDLEVNASYSLTTNTRTQYEVAKLVPNYKGTTLDGSTRTVFEPRIKYVLSQRVNAAVYYRHTKITPDAQGSAIPGSTTNEAGLDIHISIQ